MDSNYGASYTARGDGDAVLQATRKSAPIELALRDGAGVLDSTRRVWGIAPERRSLPIEEVRAASSRLAG